VPKAEPEEEAKNEFVDRVEPLSSDTPAPVGDSRAAEPPTRERKTSLSVRTFVTIEEGETRERLEFVGTGRVTILFRKGSLLKGQSRYGKSTTNVVVQAPTVK
jgi:hypothetical protein